MHQKFKSYGKGAINQNVPKFVCAANNTNRLCMQTARTSIGQLLPKRLNQQKYHTALYALGCPVFTKTWPNFLYRRYVDIHDISMGNPRVFPCHLPVPQSPYILQRELRNLRGGNGMPRFFQFLNMKIIFWMTLKPGAALLRSWRFSRHPYCHMI